VVHNKETHTKTQQDSYSVHAVAVAGSSSVNDKSGW